MFLKYNFQGIAWALLILVLFGLPGDQFDSSKKEHADIAIHALLFGVLFFLLSVGFIRQRSFPSLRNQTLRKVLAICLVYGVITEILQGTIFIDRSIEAKDMMFNAIGALAGLGCFGAIYGVREYL